MNNAQMEFGLGNNFELRTHTPLKARNRAQCWFERMRQVVDLALDWEPAPAPRPEQTWFTNTHRQVTLSPTPATKSEPRDICE